jgi:hypothetical protein
MKRRGGDIYAFVLKKKNGENEKKLLSFVECFMVQSNEYSERI